MSFWGRIFGFEHRNGTANGGSDCSAQYDELDRRATESTRKALEQPLISPSRRRLMSEAIHRSSQEVLQANKELSAAIVELKMELERIRNAGDNKDTAEEDAQASAVHSPYASNCD